MLCLCVGLAAAILSSSNEALDRWKNTNSYKGKPQRSIEQRKTSSASKHCEKKKKTTKKDNKKRKKNLKRRSILALCEVFRKKKEDDFTSNKQTAVFAQ